MNSSHVSAMESVFAASIEEFFAGKTVAEIRDFVIAPYREARETFEKGLQEVLDSSAAVAA